MSSMTMLPGPKARWLRGLLPEFKRDPLSLMTQVAQEFGPIVRLQIGPRNFLFLNDPAFIEQVLVTQNKHFVKGRGLEATNRVLGKGLLTSEGDFWRRQRRLAQPAFHRARIASYGQTMVDFTLRQTAAWRHGEIRDINREMMRLTLAIAAKTLFSADVETDADKIGEALAVCMEMFVKRTRTLIKIPESWPTPANRRAEAAARQLDEIIYRFVEERRQSGEDMGDLLSMLMHAQDEDGSRMTPEQLRDESMTIFLAGHETTANAMSWTWYLLSLNPQAADRLHEELGRVLSGRAPTVEDLPKLVYAEAVITESMRLYPPAWIMSRRSTDAFTLGEYAFPAGTDILFSQWVMHRNPAYFADPEVFRPERWLDGLAQRIPAYAYFPFGGGPRLCIGKPFAQMEAVLLLVTVAQRFRLRLEQGFTPVPQPSITLRPGGGIRMVIGER